MPRYEYECEECKNVITISHSIHIDPVIKCAKCDGKMERLISGGTGVIFTEGDGEISSKPDSYWENAERVKQSKLKKRQSAAKEKLYYKDRETMTKIENKFLNRGMAQT